MLHDTDTDIDSDNEPIDIMNDPVTVSAGGVVEEKPHPKSIGASVKKEGDEEGGSDNEEINIMDDEPIDSQHPLTEQRILSWKKTAPNNNLDEGIKPSKRPKI